MQQKPVGRLGRPRPLRQGLEPRLAEPLEVEGLQLAEPLEEEEPRLAEPLEEEPQLAEAAAAGGEQRLPSLAGLHVLPFEQRL